MSTQMNTTLKLVDRTVQVQDIQWHTEQRAISVGKKTIVLTSTEFQLLFPLRQGHPVPYIDLAATVYRCSLDEKVRMMMDKHVDRIRTKLRGNGIYVYCVAGYGYILLPEYISY